MRTPFAILILLTSLQLGCGVQNRAAQTPTPTRADEHDITTDGRDLPKNFIDQSVNKGIARKAQGQLELAISEGANTEGGFNATGIGNRAIVGLVQFDGKGLADLGKIEIQTYQQENGEPLKLVLLVDTECDNHVHVFEASITTPHFDASLDRPVWREANGEPQTLTMFPNACLRNADSRDGGLPKLQTASVLLALGSNQSVVASRAQIQRFEIGGTVFDRSTWESK